MSAFIDPLVEEACTKMWPDGAAIDKLRPEWLTILREYRLPQGHYLSFRRLDTKPYVKDPATGRTQPIPGVDEADYPPRKMARTMRAGTDTTLEDRVTALETSMAKVLASLHVDGR